MKQLQLSIAFYACGFNLKDLKTLRTVTKYSLLACKSGIGLDLIPNEMAALTINQNEFFILKL